MKILALETTERIGSVAAMSDGNLLLELNLNPRQRSAQSLAPALNEAIGEAGWHPEDVDLLATTIGPGSFTGLRVGVTTAKAFAYCAGAEVLGIGTLEAVAARAPADVERLSVGVDAQRGEVVAQTFHRGGDGWFEPADRAGRIEIGRWLDTLSAGVHLSGPILRKIAERVPDHLRMVDAEFWAPSAAAVARLAARRHASGERDDLWSLVPRYSRRSYAEEKWEKRPR